MKIQKIKNSTFFVVIFVCAFYYSKFNKLKKILQQVVEGYIIAKKWYQFSNS